MAKSWLLYLFGLDLVVELVAIYNGLDSIRYVTKPILLLLLILFVSAQQLPRSNTRHFLLSALILSLLGDIILLFDNRGQLYFMMGLISFLLAHICYILLFAHIRRINKRGPLSYKHLPWLAAYAFFFWVLTAAGFKLGAMQIPVYVYCTVIITMLLSILFAFKPQITQNKQDKRHPTAGRVALSGGFLFVVSDFLLAYNKFAEPFNYAGIAIMSTYALAQLCIVVGVLKFTRSADKP